MKKKNLMVGLVVVAVAVAALIVLRPVISKKKAEKPVSPALKGAAAKAVKPAPKVAAKRVIPKGKGLLMVKVLDARKKEIAIRAKAFRIMDRKTSVYSTPVTLNRLEEMSPGTYDIVADTIPQTIYKNITVNEGRENVEDLGPIMGAITVKIMDSKGKEASYQVRVSNSQSGETVTTLVTNRTTDLLRGVYDIEIATTPRQVRNGVRIDAGREEVIDLGKEMGSLNIKVLDPDNKEVRLTARIMKANTNELIASPLTNRSIEILRGTYDVEIVSTPRQTKKGVKVNAAEEAVVEFSVEKAPVPVAAPPVKTKKTPQR